MRIAKYKEEKTYQEKVLLVNRVSKTVTGGRTMSFSALSVIGDSNGTVGLGLGKAKNVADAVKKSISQAKKSVKKFSTKNTTIPHEVIGKFGATSVFMKPAVEGSGLVAGSAVRDILVMAGVSDVCSKVIGSKNKINVAKATINALGQLRTYTEFLSMIGRK